LNPGERRQAAGFFLDQAGAKSLVVGGAGVYEKHANILVKKTKECTAQDVYLLSQKMRNLVKEKFGITLEREVRLIGNF
jgi:UDP-N-acetylmuramate dehydrogenase